MVAEALKTSEIEGEYLSREDVRLTDFSGFQNLIGLGVVWKCDNSLWVLMTDR